MVADHVVDDGEELALRVFVPLTELYVVDQQGVCRD